eukprot:XP_794253.1 PREDICTED: neuronal acetylcholine receptor subunit beta-2-like [Strongylocentrotus purpuratus]
MAVSRVHWFVVLGVVSVLVCQSTCGKAPNPSPWTKLRSDLIGQDYDVTEIPSVGGINPLPVTVHLTLQSVKDVNEKKQGMVGTSTITVVWRDERLTWMSGHYGNITVLTLPCRLVWTPSIRLGNSNSEDSRILKNPEDIKVFIKNDGQVTLETNLLHSTACAMNLALFPFDTQTCLLLITSLDLFNTSVVLVPGVLKHRAGNRPLSWDVISMIHVSLLRFDQASEYAFSDLVVAIKLERLPHHYVFFIIVPVMLLNAVGIVSFFIPVKSGERVSTCISVVLGVTIFQIVIGDVIPQTSRSDSNPHALKYLSTSFIALVGIMLSSVAALNISYRNGSIKRKALRILFFRILATMVFKGEEGRRKMAVKITTSAWSGDMGQDGASVCPFPEGNHGKTPPEARSSEEPVSEETDMELVAIIFDRIFLFLFLVVELWMLSLIGSIFSTITKHD